MREKVIKYRALFLMGTLHSTMERVNTSQPAALSSILGFGISFLIWPHDQSTICCLGQWDAFKLNHPVLASDKLPLQKIYLINSKFIRLELKRPSWQKDIQIFLWRKKTPAFAIFLKKIVLEGSRWPSIVRTSLRQGWRGFSKKGQVGFGFWILWVKISNSGFIFQQKMGLKTWLKISFRIVRCII